MSSKITTVLDWANAMHGDFPYDVAWLDQGSPALDHRSRFKKYYRDTDRIIDRYKERLLCYQCFISLYSQRWYAKSSQPEAYDWMKQRTLYLLERGPHEM